MALPGGVFREGVRRRDFAFRPVDGSLEAVLAEAAEADTVPEAVTASLVAALAELGGSPPGERAVWDLAVGDRQYLARQLAIHLDHDPLWSTVVCGACDGPFDVEIRQADLPVKEAGETFPFAEVGCERLRVPTGADQEAVAQLADEEGAATLLVRCRANGGSHSGSDGGSSRGGSERDGSDHGGSDDGGSDDGGSDHGGSDHGAGDGGEIRGPDVDLAAVEEALELAAPEVALAVLARCPLCDAENEVAVDPYAGLLVADRGVFDEVHRLASVYHWSETDILALTRDRRQRYLRLVDRAGGGGS
jgi:hypothetical protein